MKPKTPVREELALPSEIKWYQNGFICPAICACSRVCLLVNRRCAVIFAFSFSLHSKWREMWDRRPEKYIQKLILGIIRIIYDTIPSLLLFNLTMLLLFDYVPLACAPKKLSHHFCSPALLLYIYRLLCALILCARYLLIQHCSELDNFTWQSIYNRFGINIVSSETWWCSYTPQHTYTRAQTQQGHTHIAACAPGRNSSSATKCEWLWFGGISITMQRPKVHAYTYHSLWTSCSVCRFRRSVPFAQHPAGDSNEQKKREFFAMCACATIKKAPKRW